MVMFHGYVSLPRGTVKRFIGDQRNSSDGYGSKPCFWSKLRQLNFPSTPDAPTAHPQNDQTGVSYFTWKREVVLNRANLNLRQGEQSPKSWLEAILAILFCVTSCRLSVSHPKIAQIEAPGKWISISTSWDTFCTVFHETPAPEKSKGDDSLSSELKKSPGDDSLPSELKKSPFKIKDPKRGTPSYHPFNISRWDFPWNKPSSYGGSPMTMETSWLWIKTLPAIVSIAGWCSSCIPILDLTAPC